ncbi:MAG: hypothetical protein IT233_00505 [Bacteroidia bacterium]|nr:hypothetical protein [Bacteroidia bacterium]
MNPENLRSLINELLNELGQLRANGALQDVQVLRKKISELHDQLTVLEYLLSSSGSTTVPDPESSPELKGNPAVISNVNKNELKSRVGLNDRFRFVNELFGGSSDEFNAALNQLESMKLPEEAEDYLDRLSEVYHWDKKGHACEDFTHLVQQYFGR